jgi:hypothetical protein
MEKYYWKMKGLAKGVDPSIAAEELKRLQNLHGTVTPELIVREAEKKRSPLHNIFEWDDEKAAYNHRLQQARILLNNIQVTIITDGKSREISVYEVTTRKEGYKSIDTFTPDDIEFVRNGILQDLISLKGKLKLYNEFEKVLAYIEQAIEVI